MCHPTKYQPHRLKPVSHVFHAPISIDSNILVLFGKGPPKKPNMERHNNEVFSQTAHGLYGVELETKDDADELHRGAVCLGRTGQVQSAFSLKLKACGCGLDPKYFSNVEKKALEESDAKGWAQRVKNTVVRRLTPHEAAKAPREQAFKVLVQ